MLQHKSESNSLLKLNNIPLYVYTPFSIFINWHLGCFLLFAMLHSAAMNVSAHISVQSSAFNSFGYMPENEIAESCGNSMFNFLRNLYTVFHSGYAISLSHAVKCTRVPISPHPCHTLWLLLFVVTIGSSSSSSSYLTGCEIAFHCDTEFLWLTLIISLIMCSGELSKYIIPVL